MVDIQSVVIGVLTFLLIVTLWMSYLMYVRIQQLQKEVDQLRSQVEMTDDELDRLEDSIRSIKEDTIAEEVNKR